MVSSTCSHIEAAGDISSSKEQGSKRQRERKHALGTKREVGSRGRLVPERSVVFSDGMCLPSFPREEGQADTAPLPQVERKLELHGVPSRPLCVQGGLPGLVLAGTREDTDKLGGQMIPRAGKHTASLPAAGPLHECSPMHSSGKHSQCDYGSFPAPGPPHDVRNGQGKAVTPAGIGRLQLPEEKKESMFMPVGTQATRDEAAL